MGGGLTEPKGTDGGGEVILDAAPPRSPSAINGSMEKHRIHFLALTLYQAP